MGYDEDLAPTSDRSSPLLSSPARPWTLRRAEIRAKARKVCNPWPGRGVVLVILSGNHSSQISLITASRGLAQNVPNEAFAVENRVAACRRARGARPLPRGSVSLHVLLRRGDTLVGPLRRPESVPGDLVPLALVRQRSLRGRSSVLCQADANCAREPVAFAAVTVLSLLLVLLFRYRAEGAAVTARERPVVTRG